MIERIDIRADTPLLGGQIFGATGAYRILTARARGTLDPNEPGLAGIVDLRRAPVNNRGVIEFETDLVALVPADPTLGNGRLLYEVNNRGRKQLFRFFCDASTTGGSLSRATDIGNGFVLKQGYTVIWSGWDPTAPMADAGLTLSAPILIENGTDMVRTIRDEFAVGTTHGAPDLNPLPANSFRLSYPAADLDPARAQLSTRRWPGDPPSLLTSASWEYVNERIIRLKSGPPIPGLLYDFRYPATSAPVIGLGFAATRDVVSHMRYADALEPWLGRRPMHALAIGVSQAGRYLREHLALGCNRDHAGRRVFDGVLVHVAGAGRVFANQAFATPFRTRYPHQDHDFPEANHPFSAALSADPTTGKNAALLRGDDSDPKLMECNTSSEYWKKGASLLHTDPLGKTDLPLPDKARAYLIAGTSHDGRPFMDGARGPCRYPTNPHDPSPVLRALLSALDEWVVNDIAPPASRIPSIHGGTLCEASDIAFPNLRDFAPPAQANDMDQVQDWVNPQNPTHTVQPLVCRVDRDGNELGGIRTPDTAVPLGTHTGWNFFGPPVSEAIGENIVADKHGAFVPFAPTPQNRKAAGDPRPSLLERYGKHADYVARVQDAARALLADRLLLSEDAERYVVRARQREWPDD